MKNIFKPEVTQEVIDRINKLTPESQPLWGKMNVGQMLAHCSVTYEMIYDDTHQPPKGMMKLMLRFFVKGMVTSEKPYKKNLRTAPQFLMTTEKDFEIEKKRLIDYLSKTQELGEAHFDNKESLSFGRLSINEWNNMFYKHLDHHLSQFKA
ncbi:hypothetical protein AWW67_00765 [Roseivirga seohaensis]|uniref:DUF1569 domain-containing protein n=1 Tax=Roseivirga seohaensis TaxID=1914963 RepID=A0A150Y470_9BACT|nr:DUF1569 domain-containing protein [Roseivirga seohaensis]KYG85800.1 hypothetical protein AWW67_00765 [Roseivirga seohaensis]